MEKDLTNSLENMSPCEIKKQIADFGKEIQDLFNLELRKQDLENAAKSIEDQMTRIKEGIEEEIEDKVDYYQKGIQDGIDSIREAPEYLQGKFEELEKQAQGIIDQIRKPCDE